MKLYTANELLELYKTQQKEGYPKQSNFDKLVDWIEKQKKNGTYENLSIPAFRAFI